MTERSIVIGAAAHTRNIQLADHIRMVSDVALLREGS